MHQAPPVLWHVSRTHAQAAVLSWLSALALGSQGAWWWERPEWDPVQRLCLLATVLLLAGAWRSWLRTEAGQLQWDGAQWTWIGPTGATEPGVPSVAIDGQAVMLVAFRTTAPTARRWFWLVPGEHPVRWRALRRALFASRAQGSTAAAVRLPAGPASPGSQA